MAAKAAKAAAASSQEWKIEILTLLSLPSSLPPSLPPSLSVGEWALKSQPASQHGSPDR